MYDGKKKTYDTAWAGALCARMLGGHADSSQVSRLDQVVSNMPDTAAREALVQELSGGGPETHLSRKAKEWIWRPAILAYVKTGRPIGFQNHFSEKEIQVFLDAGIYSLSDLKGWDREYVLGIPGMTPGIMAKADRLRA